MSQNDRRLLSIGDTEHPSENTESIKVLCDQPRYQSLRLKSIYNKDTAVKQEARLPLSTHAFGHAFIKPSGTLAVSLGRYQIQVILPLLLQYRPMVLQ